MIKLKTSAKVVADTVYNGKRVTSLQLVYPRFILSELNTHRMLSRSTASSRAIPTAKLLEMVECNPALPVHWGLNQSGMQASCEVLQEAKNEARRVWIESSKLAVQQAKALAALDIHKQVVNRVLEPFMWAHTIVTATEWDNFFQLRLHSDAQPEIYLLARCMKEAMDNSEPVEQAVHLPYITSSEFGDYDTSTLVDISAARCARVSYMNHDQKAPEVEKDLQTAKRLREAGHQSPFEHQAFAADDPSKRCANFIGWAQARHIWE